MSIANRRRELLAGAARVLEAETDDIIGLVRDVAGCDPATFFGGGDWSECDFRYQDLRGYDFRHSVLTDAEFRGALVGGAQFDGAIGANLSGANHDIAPGHRLTTAELNRLLRDASDFREAMTIYEALRGQVEAFDRYTRGTLMGKALTYGQAQAAYEMFKSSNIGPDIVSLTTLIARSPDLETANKWGRQAVADGLKLDAQFFNAWLKAAPSEVAARRILGLMHEHRVPPDEITFGTLIDKLEFVSDARAFLVEMDAAGVNPNLAVFRALMNRASDRTQARAALAMMEDYSLKPDTWTYNTLLKWETEPDDINRLLSMMQATGALKDLITYNLLIHKARRLDTVKLLIQDMVGDRLAPDQFTLEELARKFGFFAAMDMLCPVVVLGPKFGHHNVDAMVRLARNSGAKLAPDFLSDARRQPPWVKLVLLAVTTARTADQAAKWLIGLSKNRTDYSGAIAAALGQRLRTAEEATAITQQLQDAHVYVGAGYFRSVYRLLARTMTAEQILEWHFSQPHRRGEALDIVISAFVRRGMIRDALRIALGFAHLPAARELFCKHEKAARELFSEFMESEQANALYALAYVELHNGSLQEALATFRKAQAFSFPGPRATDIATQIADLEHKLGRDA